MRRIPSEELDSGLRSCDQGTAPSYQRRGKGRGELRTVHSLGEGASTYMTDREQYRVTLSIPWIVHGVERPQYAINITVSETGKRIARAEATHIDQSD